MIIGAIAIASTAYFLWRWMAKKRRGNMPINYLQRLAIARWVN